MRNQRTTKSRKLHGTETVTALLFADDLTALTSGPEEAEKTLDILNQECARWGLYVSFGKTYTQEWPAGNEKLQYTDESLFSVDGNKIGDVTKFKALGQNIDNTNPEGYIRYRIGQATGQFNHKRHIFTHHKE